VRWIDGTGSAVPTVSINAYNFQGAADLVIDIYGYFAGSIPTPL
jgi:hypothetical protein